jgi:hypothetical protein
VAPVDEDSILLADIGHICMEEGDRRIREVRADRNTTGSVRRGQGVACKPQP